MSNKKQFEQRCLYLTREYISSNANLKVRKYFNSLVPICNENLKISQSERPDFIGILGDYSYGIEHFLVDFCNDGTNNNQSESMRANRDVMDTYKKYHDPEVGTIKDTNIVSATQDIEDELNKIINISLSFDYGKYVEAFRRVFKHHYSRVNDYLSNKLIKGNITKIGFLIELHCDTTLMHAVYNNATVTFKGTHKAFPLTKEIVDLISTATELDFVIVSQFNEGVSVEAQDVRIYEPKDMDKSIREQRITVYDKVYYERIKKNLTIDFK